MNAKIRLIQLFNLLASVYALVLIYNGINHRYIIAAGIVYVLITGIGISVTLHRLLCHRSFKTYQWIEKVLTVISIYSTVGPGISWVGLHRYHHAHADTELDPHTPYQKTKLNFSKIFSVFTGYGWKVENIPIRYVKDLVKDPLHKWIFKNYIKILIVTILILALSDVKLLVIVYCLPATLGLLATGIVNSLGHSQGYRTYDTPDKSTNSWIANILSFGEGWHNNHHRYPGNWIMGEKVWELDPSSWFIKLIRIK